MATEFKTCTIHYSNGGVDKDTTLPPDVITNFEKYVLGEKRTIAGASYQKENGETVILNFEHVVAIVVNKP